MVKSFLRVGLVLFAAAMQGCEGNQDKKEIEQVIEGMRVSAEAKDFSQTVEPVTNDYSDNLRQKKSNLQPRLGKDRRSKEV